MQWLVALEAHVQASLSGRHACSAASHLLPQGPRCPLQCRLLFHIAHRSGNEAQLMQRHGQMGGGLEDQLSLAAVHFERGQVQVRGAGERAGA